MGSREGGSTSGSSTDSIDGDVLGRHASRSLSSQPDGNIDTVIISSDSEPSGNSEITNRNETSNVVTQSGEPSENSEPTTQSHVFYCCHTGRPLIFESQDSESSNLDTQSQEPSENSETTQSEDPNKCRQIFATESDTQYKFVLVCPEDADESNENADGSGEIVDESTEIADTSSDTVI